ncbi:MAG: hypothetical protein WAQ98_21700 [Blastocatellia bacterium]
MLWRLVSLFLFLTIATGNVVAVFSYLEVGKRDACCSKVSVSKTQEKQSCSTACCAQGKSPIGSPVAKLCCDTTCGEHNNSDTLLQPETPKPIPFPNLLSATPVLPNWSFLEKLFITTKFLDKAFLYNQPTELYLHNSAFLI